MVITGLERVLSDPGLLAEKGRLGLLYHQASVDSRFRAAPDLLAQAFPRRLVVLFGPQHGICGTEQDNMKETEHSTHPRLGLPVYSLYFQSRQPSSEMLTPVDTVLVDLQDVGARVYTYCTTVLRLMEACAQADKGLVVLDRPNPINGKDVEGNLLDRGFASFVGPHPIPMRHGLTIGELMIFYNEVYSIGCRLDVVSMEGWNRNRYFDATGLPWVIPSPNMPLVETAVVYPGQVILEGSNISEGRGTTRPFEIFGAPYFEPERLLENIETDALTGAILHQTDYRPTFNKWADQVCRGFQIHVVDREVFRPYRFTLALVGAVLKLYRHDFCWSGPPYEYVYDKLPVDVILGDARVRTDLESGRSVFDMEQEWLPGVNEFIKLRSRFLLYPE
jgi:uncharacterized protein YbbC (DUF1343 family)